MKISPDKARSIADAIDAYDEDIAALQEGKRDTFASLREELEAEGLDRAEVKAEIAALKAAITIRAKRRKDDTAEDREALTETYLEALASVARGARTREGANEIASNLLQKAAQSEGATGESPEQGSGVRAGLDGGMGTSAQPDQFVTQSGEGEDAVAPSVDPSPAADDTIRMPSGAEAGSAVRTGAPIIAKPYDPGPIPAFLDRRVRA